MHALLITGGTPESRRQKIEEYLTSWKISPHDRVVLTTENASVGIADVRAFQKRLQLAPLGSEATVGIIPAMELLTVEAQNALLKTLEEPPPHGRIIGAVHSAQALLPTILSRMQVVPLLSEELNEEDVAQTLTIFSSLKTLSPGKRLVESEKLADSRETAEQVIEKSLYAIDHAVRHQSDWVPSDLASLGRGLLTARKQLAANVNYRLVLDNLALHI